ncbi:MAG TPA: hypothetical protein VJS11_11140, partial [Acidobacteriaceae bacterium]|nr:hypothetical protein [Acidobacteriaceae bacterium]
ASSAATRTMRRTVFISCISELSRGFSFKLAKRRCGISVLRLAAGLCRTRAGVGEEGNQVVNGSTTT